MHELNFDWLCGFKENLCNIFLEKREDLSINIILATIKKLLLISSDVMILG